MQIKLIFHDWHDKDGFSVYQTRNLTGGQFHHGAVFNGAIYLDADDAEELARAMKSGNTPVFEVGLTTS